MTRALVLLLVAASFLAAVPPVTGQDMPAAPLLADDEGDAMTAVAGTQGPSASSVYPGADLVALSLSESASELTWVLEVNDLRPASEETGADGVAYDIRFEHHGRFFMLHLIRSLPTLQDGAYAYLSARDASDGYWGTVWSSSYNEVVQDFSADTFTVSVPRLVLADADGAPPFPGRNLTGISVRAVTTTGGGIIYTGGSGSPLLTPYTIVDDMPDQGEPPAAYTILIGVQQEGHAHLASATPFRASNGEATTFVFQVEATNNGPDEETFELTVRDVPSRMTVVLPVPLLPIPSNTTFIVPVLANVPFAHVHGALDTWLLELTSLDDPDSVGRLEMGINYLAVPQPAGHHDVLFLHNPDDASATPGVLGSILPYTIGTMSTLEDEGPLPPFRSDSLTITGLGARFTWQYDLAPALQMGLDVDLERNGQVSITVGTTAPLMQATLEGSLYVVGQDSVLVGSFAPHAPVDIGAQGEHTFELDFVPWKDADEVPLQPGNNLQLEISLYGSTVPGFPGNDAAPYIAPGGSMRLPLNEFHDDVDDALAAVDGPVLTPLGDQERFVNPGEAVVFNVSVENPTNESVPFRLAVTGQNAAWATLPEDSFVMPPESNATFSLIVRAPTDALDGDRADLIVQAYPRDEPSLRGLLRLVVDVDTDVDYADEAPLADRLSKSKGTPGPATPLLLLAIAAVALAARRRTR